MARSRNVLLIVTDQWRGDSLGLLGHPAARTPNLDALARDGVLFRRHFGQSAPCGPARASLLTGLYVMNHRVVANGVPLDARHTNLALEARRGGVDPALIGYTTTIPDPRAVGTQDARFAEIGDVMDGWRVVAHFDEVEFRNWAAWVAHRGHPVPEDPQDLWRPAEGPSGPSAAPARIPTALSDTAWSAEHAVEFLRGTRPGRPWLLHLGFFRPHPPFAAPAPWHEAVAMDSIPPPLRAATAAAEAAQHPLLAHWLSTQKRGSYFQGAEGPMATLTDAEVALARRAYFGLIAELDDAMGRVLAALRAGGQWDDTLIVFTSDHGEQLGDHGLFGKLGWFDQSYHLPLIIRDPDAAAAGARGRVVEAFTESVDLMPTLLDWLGLPVPRACDGLSLRPWLHGATPSAWRDAVHYEYDLRGGWPDPWRMPLGIGVDEAAMAAMRTARWKYVHFAALQPVLYDLEADPQEMRNIAGDPASAGLLAEAAGRMLSWRMAHADRTLTHLSATPRGLADRRVPGGVVAGRGAGGLS
ncbi:alkaline phosphatase family protein [Falsiroseomonas oryzae]|uniref:alkaline phosphatase family protein n=1 Tax=Falsiroseomonas oryzae TaxID=2766473 RepID=UPI0022EB3FBB|nr:alkaline phosphatase family protein [Roseomonas sp. MO-31]